MSYAAYVGCVKSVIAPPPGDVAPGGTAEVVPISGGTIAIAVFSSLAAVGVACGAIVYFKPKSSFRVAGRTVVPAELIKGSVAGVAAAGGSVASSVASLWRGGYQSRVPPPSGAIDSGAFSSGSYGAAANERASLL